MTTQQNAPVGGCSSVTQIGLTDRTGEDVQAIQGAITSLLELLPFKDAPVATRKSRNDRSDVVRGQRIGFRPLP